MPPPPFQSLSMSPSYNTSSPPMTPCSRLACEFGKFALSGSDAASQIAPSSMSECAFGQHTIVMQQQKHSISENEESIRLAREDFENEFRKCVAQAASTTRPAMDEMATPNTINIQAKCIGIYPLSDLNSDGRSRDVAAELGWNWCKWPSTADLTQSSKFHHMRRSSLACGKLPRKQSLGPQLSVKIPSAPATSRQESTSEQEHEVIVKNILTAALIHHHDKMGKVRKMQSHLRRQSMPASYNTSYQTTTQAPSSSPLGSNSDLSMMDETPFLVKPIPALTLPPTPSATISRQAPLFPAASNL